MASRKQIEDAGGHVDVLPARLPEVEKLISTIVESAAASEPAQVVEAILAEIASATSPDELFSTGLEVKGTEEVVGLQFDILSVRFFPSRFGGNGSSPAFFAAARCKAGDETFVWTTSAVRPLAKLAKALSEGWLPIRGVTVTAATTNQGRQAYDLVKVKA
jgi:hypothetical protein